jgi:hypothetical protein
MQDVNQRLGGGSENLAIFGLFNGLTPLARVLR